MISGKGPPSDSAHFNKSRVYVPVYLYIIMSCLASAGIITALSFLLINVIFRERR